MDYDIDSKRAHDHQHHHHHANHQHHLISVVSWDMNIRRAIHFQQPVRYPVDRRCLHLSTSISLWVDTAVSVSPVSVWLASISSQFPVLSLKSLHLSELNQCCLRSDSCWYCTMFTFMNPSNENVNRLLRFMLQTNVGSCWNIPKKVFY